MSWSTPYIIVRPDGEGEVEIVHTAAKIKDARYWLNYIAQPNDALLQTPAHPKHSGAGKPTYLAHLVSRGNVGYEEGKWAESLGIGSAQDLNPEPK